jgi:hypothetical protein
MPALNAFCSACGKPVQRGPNSRPQIVCNACRGKNPQRKSYGDPRTCALPECGVIYTPTRTAQRFCSKPCADKGGILTGSRTARPCEICGSQFKPKGGGKYKPGCVQRTCSRACGVELRRREGMLKGRPRPYVLGSTGLVSRVYIRPCEHCGKLFVGRRKASRFCSLRCTQTALAAAACRRAAAHAVLRYQPGARSAVTASPLARSCGGSARSGPSGHASAASGESRTRSPR